MGFGNFFKTIKETANEVMETAGDKATEYINQKKLEIKDKKIIKENKELGINVYKKNAIFPDDNISRLKNICSEIKRKVIPDKIDIKINLEEFKTLLYKNNIADENFYINESKEIRYAPFDIELSQILNKFFVFDDRDIANDGYAFLDITTEQCKLNGILFLEEGIIFRIGTEKSFMWNWNDWINSFCIRKELENNDGDETLEILEFTEFKGSQFSCLSNTGLDNIRECIFSRINCDEIFQIQNKENFFLYLKEIVTEEIKLDDLSKEELNQISYQTRLMEGATQNIEEKYQAFELEAKAYINYLNSIDRMKKMRDFKEKVELIKKKTKDYKIKKVDELVELYDQKLKNIGPLLQKELQQIAIEDNITEAKKMENEIDYLGMNVFLYSVIYNSINILEKFEFTDKKNDFNFDAYSFAPIYRDEDELMELMIKKDPKTKSKILHSETMESWAELKGEVGYGDAGYKASISAERMQVEAKQCLENALKRCYDSGMEVINDLSKDNEDVNINNRIKEVENKIVEAKGNIATVIFNDYKDGKEKRKNWLDNEQSYLINKFKKNYEKNYKLEKDEFETIEEFEKRRLKILNSEIPKEVEQFKKIQLNTLLRNEEEELLKNQTFKARKNLENLELEKKELEKMKSITVMKNIIMPGIVLNEVSLMEYNADNEQFKSQIIIHFKARKNNIMIPIFLNVPRSIARDFKANFDKIIFSLEYNSKFKKVQSMDRTKLVGVWNVILKYRFLENELNENFNYEEVLIDIPDHFKAYNYEEEIAALR